MTALRSRSSALPVAGFGLLAAGVYATAITIVSSPLFGRAPELGAAAVTFDLAVTVPFFFWLLVVRRTRLPWISVIPVFMASLLAASWVLPADRQQYLALARLLIAPAEAALVGYAGLRVWRLLRRAPAGGDVVAGIRSVAREILPHRRVADVAAAEIALLWYALGAWRARPEVAPEETAFPAHRKSGLGGMVGAVAFACAGEALGVHLLVERWSPLAAWALTALSVYGVVWLVGLGRSVALRPTVVSGEVLRVRVGLLWEVEVPVGKIASVAVTRATPAPRRAPGYLHAALFATPRLTLQLAEPVEAAGMYGNGKVVEKIGLYVDDPHALAAALEGGRRIGRVAR